MDQEQLQIEVEKAALEAYCKGLYDLSRMMTQIVRPEVLADCLVSNALTIIAGIHGVPIAAERMRQAADVYEQTNPETSH